MFFYGGGGGGSSSGTITNLTPAFVVKTADYTLTDADCVCFADASSNSVTITLPDAVGIGGRIYFIKVVNFSNAVKIATTSGQTIDGVSGTLQLMNTYEHITLVSNNANWFIIG